MASPSLFRNYQFMLDISKFYVIAVCSNPVRYQTRWDLFKKFEQHVAELGGKLVIVEQAFGHREFQLTHSHNPHHIQLRTDHELWHKENMINIGVNRLTAIDPNWEYVAWIDGDISFQRKDVFKETAQQLQHYDIVQMFSHVVDTGPQHEYIQQNSGFVYMYHQNLCYAPQTNGHGGYYAAPTHGQTFWHPGYAWAARRRFFDKIQLLDQAVLGAGDHHMALALIGQAARSLPGQCSPAYKEMVLAWEKQAGHAFQRNIGYVPGLINHYWHGSKSNRKYIERWKIITKNQFNPWTDLVKDSYGLYRLNMCHGERSIRLRDDIRLYFRQRNEDSIDWDGRIV